MGEANEQASGPVFTSRISSHPNHSGMMTATMMKPRMMTMMMMMIKSMMTVIESREMAMMIFFLDGASA